MCVNRDTGRNLKNNRLKTTNENKAKNTSQNICVYLNLHRINRSTGIIRIWKCINNHVVSCSGFYLFLLLNIAYIAFHFAQIQQRTTNFTINKFFFFNFIRKTHTQNNCRVQN